MGQRSVRLERDESGWRGTWHQEGGAVLINQGIHGVDLLRWLAGPVSHVFGYADHLRRDIEADDSTVAVVRDGRLPLVTGIEGRASLEVVLAIYESAREGREVELALPAARF